jgi:hypothetical protein
MDGGRGAAPPRALGARHPNLSITAPSGKAASSSGFGRSFTAAAGGGAGAAAADAFAQFEGAGRRAERGI